ALAVAQGLCAGLRDDVAALDAAARARRPAHVRRLEGAAADLARARAGVGRARDVALDGQRLRVGPLGRLAGHAARGRLPVQRDAAGAAVEPRARPRARRRRLARARAGAAMREWLVNVWEGFFTVLVGMRITWRHIFTKPVTLQYPSERWPLP